MTPAAKALGFPELAGVAYYLGHGYTDADLCLYFNQMSNLLAMIGREVRGARTPPDRVYLFGDHAPPYAVASERNFFNRKEVPFITLRRVSSPPAAASS